MADQAGEGPPGGPPLDVWGEWERLVRAAGIRDPESRRGVPWSLFRLTPPTRDRLVDHLSLAEHQDDDAPGYQVVHLGCHGCPEGIFLEARLGRESFVSTADLVTALRGHGVRLVVFNACETEAVAAELVRRRVAEGALAARTPIYDNEAAVVAQRLYAGLAVGRPVGEAVEEARRALVERYDRGDWPAGENPETARRAQQPPRRTTTT